jgi:Fe2+ transport system protein FeoA
MMLTLAMITAGEDVQLVNIIGGRILRKRLADLGLNPGMNLRVVQVDPQGPMILAVKDSRIALGRGMAQKVMVELIG